MQLKDARDAVRADKSPENVQEKTKFCEDLIKSMVKNIVDNVLAVPPPDTELMLLVDASVLALGGVLQTKDKKPIIFISKKFQPSEMSMTIFEKELYSILVMVRKAEPFIRRVGYLKYFQLL